MDEHVSLFDHRTRESVMREEFLLEFLRHLEPRKHERRSAHVALSRLSPLNRRQSHLRLASDGLTRLATSGAGQLFQLANDDLLFFHQASIDAVVRTELARLRILFAEDPLLQNVEDAAAFCRVYDLSKEFSGVVKLVRDPATSLRSCGDAAESGGERLRVRWQLRGHAGRPVPPKLLPKLDAALARTELSNFVRRQPVCRMAADSLPHLLFSELSVSLQALCEAIVPGCDLAAERSVARYLTRTLDRRLLSMLSRQDAQDQRRHLAVPLSLSTLLSESFRCFDGQMSMSRRGSIVLKVSLPDIISDLDVARFAFRLARHRGYRTLLSGISPLVLPLVTLEGLGIDFVRCDCNASLVEDPTLLDQLAEVSRRLAPARLVLADAHSQDALAIGLRAGIELFQGGWVDRALRAPGRRPHRSLVFDRGDGGADVRIN